MIAKNRFSIFNGAITTAGKYNKSGLISVEGYRNVPLSYIEKITFVAKVTSWVGSANPVCDIKIVHSPDSLVDFQLGAFAPISGNGTKLLTPEGQSTELIFNKIAVHVAELTNVTSFNLEVTAICG